MSNLVRATETFAWSGGMVYSASEHRADDRVVEAFPQWFEPVDQDEPAAKRPPRAKGVRNG